jgi:transposase
MKCSDPGWLQKWAVPPENRVIWSGRTPLVEFDRLVETLLGWGDEIFSFHDTGRVTNGRIEGTNNRLGVLKRVACGFVNVINFAARALLATPGMPTSPCPRIHGPSHLTAQN